MIKIEHVETFGWETAVRGLRNPLNSWERADSSSLKDYEGYSIGYMVGPDDKRLMKSLVKAGTDHSKFMRMIGIGMDITSHQVWWAEFDTYKVGTVRNSCSKMHTIHIKSFEPDDFSHEGIDEVGGGTKELFLRVLVELEALRILFNETKERKYWRAIIELLPSGYNLRATVTLNYAVARNQYHARKNHKLDEWHDYCKMLEALPLSNLITMEAQKE
jgi:hypothetical protein